MIIFDFDTPNVPKVLQKGSRRASSRTLPMGSYSIGALEASAEQAKQERPTTGRDSQLLCLNTNLYQYALN